MKSNITAISRFVLPVIAFLALCLVSGCGGGSSRGAVFPTGGVAGPSVTGAFQGVYLNTTGKSAPASGTAQLSVSSAGVAMLKILSAPKFNSPNAYTGSLIGARLSLAESGDNTLSGSVSRNSSTGEVTVSYTLGDGTQGVLYAGPAPASTSLTGGYFGSYPPVYEGLSLGIGPTGLVVAGAGQVNPPLYYPTFWGYVDSNGVLYIAYYNGNYEIAVGKIALSGVTLSGTLHEMPSGNTAALSFTVAGVQS